MALDHSLPFAQNQILNQLCVAYFLTDFNKNRFIWKIFESSLKHLAFSVLQQFLLLRFQSQTKRGFCNSLCDWNNQIHIALSTSNHINSTICPTWSFFEPLFWEITTPFAIRHGPFKCIPETLKVQRGKSALKIPGAEPSIWLTWWKSIHHMHLMGVRGESVRDSESGYVLSPHWNNLGPRYKNESIRREWEAGKEDKFWGADEIIFFFLGFLWRSLHLPLPHQHQHNLGTQCANINRNIVHVSSPHKWLLMLLGWDEGSGCCYRKPPGPGQTAKMRICWTSFFQLVSSTVVNFGLHIINCVPREMGRKKMNLPKRDQVLRFIAQSLNFWTSLLNSSSKGGKNIQRCWRILLQFLPFFFSARISWTWN